MLAMLLKTTLKQTTEGSALNLPTVEAMSKGMYGLWKVFGDCRHESDWKKPTNAPRNWRSKVKWHLIKHYDTAALAQDEDRMPELEAEVAENLQREANLQKNLNLSTQLSATLDGADPGGDNP